MALNTFGALKDSISAWSTKTALTAQFPDFVAWAHEEICRRVRAPVLYERADVSVDAETVAAPSGYLAAKRFFLDLSPRIPLQVTDSAQLTDLTAMISPCDHPTHFASEGGDTLAFAPLFTGACTGKLLYYKAPDALVNDSDSNVVLAKYPFLYLYGALEALFRYLEDDNNADRYGGLFGALIDSINAEEGKDALRGPLSATASGAVV